MRKLNRVQIRCILDFMGVPFHQHGSNQKEMTVILNASKEQNPERFKTAYDAIVLHKVGGEVQEPKEGKYYRDLAALAADFEVNIKNQANKEIKESMLKQSSEIIRNGLGDVNLKVQQAIKEATEKTIPHTIKINDRKSKKLDFVPPPEFDTLVELACCRKNIFLSGPAGCGKTFIASKVAEHLELDFSSQSCSAGMSESLLSGWLLPIGSSNNFKYVQSEFVRIYENGGVFLLDEIDAADPNVLIFINSAIANEQFVLPQRFEQPVVKKHKDFVCIAAANTFGTGATGTYHGRNALDGATLDRFRSGMLTMDYSAPLEEAKVDPEILAWGRLVRAAINHHKLLRIMSTRAMLDFTDMKLRATWTMEKVSEIYFSDWGPEEKLMVRQYIRSNAPADAEVA